MVDAATDQDIVSRLISKLNLALNWLMPIAADAAGRERRAHNQAAVIQPLGFITHLIFCFSFRLLGHCSIGTIQCFQRYSVDGHCDFDSSTESFRGTSCDGIRSPLARDFSDLFCWLGHGSTVLIASYDNWVSYFELVDMDGFTPLSARLSPQASVDLLNEVFTAFDRLVEKYSVENIRTTGWPRQPV